MLLRFCLCKHLYVRLTVCIEVMWVYLPVRVRVCVCVCVSVCVCVCVCVCAEAEVEKEGACVLLWLLRSVCLFTDFQRALCDKHTRVSLRGHSLAIHTHTHTHTHSQTLTDTHTHTHTIVNPTVPQLQALYCQ